MTDHDPLAGLCAYLIWLGGEQPDGWADQVRRSLRFLVTIFTAGPVPQDRGDDFSPPLSSALGHLRLEWSQMPLPRIDVADLAAIALVSRSYLNRLFRAEFGVSVGEGLERLRCSRAETLLSRTDMAIGAVARQCGFADLFHFSHRFARRYGTTPTAYRSGSAASSVLEHPGVRRLAVAVWG